MTPDEVARFGESVAGTAARHWGPATGAPTADLAAVWAAGAAQGWFDLGPADALDAALAAARELGRVACPLPVIDGFVAARLLDGDDKLTARIRSGDLRVLVSLAHGPQQAQRPHGGEHQADYLDAAQAATHVLILPPGPGPGAAPGSGRGAEPGRGAGAGRPSCARSPGAVNSPAWPCPRGAR